MTSARNRPAASAPQRRRCCFRAPALFLLLAPLLLLLSCSNPDSGAKIYEQEKVLMGTVFSFKAETDGMNEDEVREAFASGFRRIAELESEMSEWIAQSPVSRAAENAGSAPVTISRDLARVSALSLAISDSTDGLFDSTFLPLGRLWDIKHRKAPPPPDSIAMALRHVDYRHVRLDTAHRTLFLERKGMKIGFGGIAKGYAAREAGRILEKAGIGNYIINAGGDLWVHGRKRTGEWTSGIQDPDRKDAPPILRFRIKRNCAVATSGGYENFFTWKGRRYHHILDLRTGRPARGMKSATVFALDPAHADAYATAFFVMEPNAALERVRRDTSIAFVLVDSAGTLYRSPNLSGFIEE
ncbi:FAD:protein FMN transferase [Chlorobium sp. N1]|uniref:FAD:protein FMN transferase n=1 Tax=Chlorobium sp. N1 TaxID=2491138 RepID=UPI00103DD631|nr:FAD:protein FMN transferase [Chlorobium sp. N1]TCD47487.1 FAD:protein FMN transferase [Chlorobium sp. N1]